MDNTGKADLNQEFRFRTKATSLRIIRLYQHLPHMGETQVIGKQLLRSATSVAANYRAAHRGRSAAKWYANVPVCVEEPDETQFWLELLGDAGIISTTRLRNLEGVAANRFCASHRPKIV